MRAIRLDCAIGNNRLARYTDRWNRAINIFSTLENEEHLDPCDCNYRRGALVGPASAADLAIRTIEHRTLERFLRRNYSVEELRRIAEAD